MLTRVEHLRGSVCRKKITAAFDGGVKESARDLGETASKTAVENVKDLGETAKAA